MSFIESKTIAYRETYSMVLDRDAEFFIGHEISGVSISHEYIRLYASGWLVIKWEYAWNGPNKPAIDTRSFKRGSLAHDAIYQLIQLGLLSKKHRKSADKVMYRLCREDGMNWAYAQLCYWAVRGAGWWFTRKKKEKKIKYAP